MPYAITQLCCTDASCVTACPVNCIHPTPDEPDFGTTDMLYVDPRTCIDCGACAEVCPVDAVHPVESLTGALADYPAINAEYFAGTEPAGPPEGSPLFHDWGPVRFDRVLPADFPELDVAVVGSGPAGMYTVQDLLLHTTARVTLYDRLPVAGGLVRFGVAPDHPDTKRIGESFARYHDHHRLRLRLGTDVGSDVGVDELARRHDAVVYAVGAPTSKTLGVPGEELAGNLPSTTVVGWYNGHPEIGADAVAVWTRRAPSGSRWSAPATSRSTSPGCSPPTRRGSRTAPSPRPPSSGCGRAGSARSCCSGGAARSTPPTPAASCSRCATATTSRSSSTTTTRGWARRSTPRRPATTRRCCRACGVSAPRTCRRPGGVGGSSCASTRRRRRCSATTTCPASGSAGRTGRPSCARGSSCARSATGDARSPACRSTRRPAPSRTTRAGWTAVAGTYVVGWIKRGPGGGIGVNRRDAAETVASLIEDGKSGLIGTRPRRGLLRRRATRPV